MIVREREREKRKPEGKFFEPAVEPVLMASYDRECEM